MNRGRRVIRSYRFRWRGKPHTGVPYVVRNNPLGVRSGYDSLPSQSGSDSSVELNSEREFNDVLMHDYPRGVANTSPIAGSNCLNNFNALSSYFVSKTRTIQDKEEENHKPPVDSTHKENELSHSAESSRISFQPDKVPHGVRPGFNSSDGTGNEAVHEDSQQKGYSFDICEEKNKSVVKLKDSIFVKNRAERNEMNRPTQGENIKSVRTGMVLLKGYLPLTEQVELIKSIRKLGLGPGGFYQPGYRDGATLRLKMMCLGLNWDPETRSYGKTRPIDEATPPLIPNEFQQLVKRAIQVSRDYLDYSKGENARNTIPPMSPNICIVNFYTKTGRLGLHQDKDETPESIQKGLPVVSFSLGDSCEFLYGEQRGIDKADRIKLESGDVLIFGGESRLIFHGVRNIIPDTAPKDLLKETDLKPGRLNLTFREY